MNRICLKRKETQKKSGITVSTPETNQNTCPSELEDLSNSQISKTTSQCSRNNENQKMFEEFQTQYDLLRKQY